MSAIRVIAGGLQTTVQDRGRWGWQASGVSVSGAMDPCALRIANALVQNSPELAALEVALIGPEIEFEDARMIALSGAAIEATVDGAAAPMHTAFRVGPGTRLRCGRCTRGARSYLAVSGGVAVPAFLGSRSTHLVTRMGGIEGRALRAGDRLPLGTQTATQLSRGRCTLPADLAREIARSLNAGALRVVADRQADRFDPAAIEALQSAPYTVTPQSDRMGYRLQGPLVDHARQAGGADIIPDVTPIGTLQVPASRQPILLMADRQTTGGYTRIATAIAADIGVAAQLAPGDRVSFVSCSSGDALAARIAQERLIMAFEDRARA